MRWGAKGRELTDGEADVYAIGRSRAGAAGFQYAGGSTDGGEPRHEAQETAAGAALAWTSSSSSRGDGRHPTGRRARIGDHVGAAVAAAAVLAGAAGSGIAAACLGCMRGGHPGAAAALRAGALGLGGPCSSCFVEDVGNGTCTWGALCADPGAEKQLQNLLKV